MKICTKHFAELREALTKKGMWQLVDLDPQVIEIKMNHWLTGKTTDEQFCPLVACMAEIRHKALEMMGPEQTWRRCQVGHACPLCEVEFYLQNSGAGKQWIDNVTDMMILLCETNNIKRQT